ncbi:MAG: hypothetical protein EBZ60_10030 [Betaproteobacteria bacterium]|nr:hypothetical protein [Betaproteobacteria bacterium]
MTENTFDITSKPSSWDDQIAFVLIFVPCFVLLFSFALLGQLVGVHWKGWLPGAEDMTNMISGVKASVYTFMSYII